MSRQVLVVDDADDIRAIAQLGLEMSRDWTVLTATSGPEALALAASHQPDVILLDLMMPEMDGKATLQSLKSNATTEQIPVILLTAKQSSLSQQAQTLGAAAVLTKPFRPLLLADEICQILGW